MAAGVNLPILLEALSILREHMPLKQLLNQLKKMSRECFQICSEQLEKFSQSNQEERMNCNENRFGKN